MVHQDELEQALRAARYQPLSNEIVRDVLDVPSSRATLILNALVARGQLIRRGQTRGTRYELPQERAGGHRRAPTEADRSMSKVCGANWLHIHRAGGQLRNLYWLLRRHEHAQPWPLDEMGIGFAFLLADRIDGTLHVCSRATVAQHRPFRDVVSLWDAYRSTGDLLPSLGISKADWFSHPYNERRTRSGGWPLAFSCWVVEREPVQPVPLDASIAQAASPTGWVRLT